MQVNESDLALNCSWLEANISASFLNQTQLDTAEPSPTGNKQMQTLFSGAHYGLSQGQYPFPYNPGQMWPEENWNSWNRVFKLLLLSFVSTIGTMGSIFIISAITVIDTFQVRGNCYLVSLAFGHLLVTILVLPASAIAIMADVKEDSAMCHFQWLITVACFVVSVLSYLFMSIDNYFSMKSIDRYQMCCTRCRIVLFILFIWTAAFIFPFMQHYYNYGPEFCKDKRNWTIRLEYHPYILG